MFQQKRTTCFSIVLVSRAGDTNGPPITNHLCLTPGSGHGMSKRGPAGAVLTGGYYGKEL